MADKLAANVPLTDHDARRVIANWQEVRVKDSLGREFRSTSTRILIRKPGWMPGRMYRWLMRSIVIEERPASPVNRAVRRRVRAR